MATITQLAARLIDLFGPAATAVPTALYGNLTVSPSGNILVGSVTDASNGKLQVTGNTALSGNLNFSSESQRITGDFSNTTIVDRVIFQSSTTNGNTSVGAAPNGTGAVAALYAMNASGITNSAYASLGANASACYVQSSVTGSGTQLPLQFLMGSAVSWAINTAYQLSYEGTVISAGSFGSGIFNINTTTNTIRVGIQGHANDQGYGIVLVNGSEQSTTTNALVFLNSSGSQVGGVTCTTSATAYNTTSDYRLKENVKPLKGALERVMRTPVVTYNFINDDRKEVHDGFLAHELQVTLPRAVHGRKDAVRKTPILTTKGEPTGEQYKEIEPQLVDHSKAVPLLWAAIQELKQELDAERQKSTALQQEVASLKNQKV
jgi:hypothetical protein